MSSKWTHDNMEGRSVKGCTIWDEQADGLPLKVATVHPNGKRIISAEYMHNVRLITSAPEMFELLSVLCKDRAITRATHDAFEARHKARELLAVIEGVGSDLP